MDNSVADRWSPEIISKGFTPVPNLLIQYRKYLGMSVTEFYVLLAIEKWRWDNDQKPWPSIKTLVKQTGLSASTIGRATQGLESVGLIGRIHRYNASNLYDMQPLIEELHHIAINVEGSQTVNQIDYTISQK
ncbi:MAG TPA: helix-turn-helix domain-containing protein [Candidatus Saccharimonadales bacterium]